jgi:hypothetical protein
MLEIDGREHPDSDWPMLCAKVLIDAPMPLLDAELSDLVFSEVENFVVKGRDTHEKSKLNDLELYNQHTF